MESRPTLSEIYSVWCRRCYQLAYASSRENAGDRATRRADRLRARLIWEPGILNDEGFKPKTVNTKTLKTDGTGVRIEPRHVHAELRRIADLTGTDLDTQFPLAGDSLRLFG